MYPLESKGFFYLTGIEEVYNVAMAGVINQMQIGYESEEDRLRFRVNTHDGEEFRFWITRRFSLIWLKILKDHLAHDPDIASQATPEAKEAVREFKQAKAEQQANFTQPFSSSPESFPLGEESLLAFKLSYSYKGQMMNLTIEPKEGRGISLMINRDLNLSMTRLILAAGQKAGWKLEESQGSTGTLLQENGERKIIN